MSVLFAVWPESLVNFYDSNPLFLFSYHPPLNTPLKAKYNFLDIQYIDLYGETLLLVNVNPILIEPIDWSLAIEILILISYVFFIYKSGSLSLDVCHAPKYRNIHLEWKISNI